jgi:4-hydroxy-2-oxoheptanedioate aldolase
MRPNPLREIWSRGGAVVNGWLSVPYSFTAETMAQQGWDSLTIDMQHGLADYATMLQALTAISTTATAPLVRVPWLDPGILMKALDAGAYGVICPLVNSAEEAERLVRATTYPPRGERSYGPIRATVYAGADYTTHADRTIVRFAMIETAKGLENLDAILAVEGLDAIYIGPADLSAALGVTPGFDPEDKTVVEAIDMIARKTLAAGKVPGIHTGSPAYAKRMIAKGFRFVTISSDMRLLAQAAQAIVAEMRGGAAPAKETARTY